MKNHQHHSQDDTWNTNGHVPMSVQVQAPPALLSNTLARLGLGDDTLPPEVSSAQKLSGEVGRELRTRIRSIRALGTPGTCTPPEALIAALRDEDVFVRAAAVQTLGALANHMSVEHLAGALNDPSWYVRATAVLALGNQPGSKNSALLEEALHDEDMSVREAAQHILSRFPLQVELHTDNALKPAKDEQQIKEVGNQRPTHKARVRSFVNIAAAIIVITLIVGTLIGVLDLVQQSRTKLGTRPVSSPTEVQHFVMMRMDGIAMEPTLRNGMPLVINTSAYHFHHPERGDIIALYAPYNPKVVYIKRIIAIPGDIITINHTTVIVNGKVLHEPYVDPKNQGNIFDYKHINNLRVPANEYFVLGDNRIASSDSRDWGFVPLKNIIGRVMLNERELPATTPTATP